MLHLLHRTPLDDYFLWYPYKFCVRVLFGFVNSIPVETKYFVTGKTDRETKKSKRKCFFQQKCFWSEPKTFASFPGVSFVEKHEENKWPI